MAGTDSPGFLGPRRRLNAGRRLKDDVSRGYRFSDQTSHRLDIPAIGAISPFAQIAEKLGSTTDAVRKLWGRAVNNLTKLVFVKA